MSTTKAQPKMKYDRSISSFKNHIKKASKIRLKNKTGEQEVKHIYSGDSYITFEMNEKIHKIHYPRNGFMRLVNKGKLVFLDGYNGNIILECSIAEYANGEPVPEFIDYPNEDEDYIKRTRKPKKDS